MPRPASGEGLPRVDPIRFGVKEEYSLSHHSSFLDEHGAPRHSTAGIPERRQGPAIGSVFVSDNPWSRLARTTSRESCFVTRRKRWLDFSGPVCFRQGSNRERATILPCTPPPSVQCSHPPHEVEVDPKMDLRRLQPPQRQSAALTTGLRRQ